MCQLIVTKHLLYKSKTHTDPIGRWPSAAAACGCDGVRTSSNQRRHWGDKVLRSSVTLRNSLREVTRCDRSVCFTRPNCDVVADVVTLLSGLSVGLWHGSAPGKHRRLSACASSFRGGETFSYSPLINTVWTGDGFVGHRAEKREGSRSSRSSGSVTKQHFGRNIYSPASYGLDNVCSHQ